MQLHLNAGESRLLGWFSKTISTTVDCLLVKLKRKTKQNRKGPSFKNSSSMWGAQGAEMRKDGSPATACFRNRTGER